MSMTNQISGLVFEAPPSGFSEHPLLTPRGAMMVATHGQEGALAQLWAELRAVTTNARLLDAAATCAQVPALRTEPVLRAVLEPDAADMDVQATHQGFLHGLRRAGGRLTCDAAATSLQRIDGQAGEGTYEAPFVLNAAGAWADEVAALACVRPIGLQPRRRSAFVFVPPEGFSIAAWPATVSISEDWYFKPDAGMLLGSPANADLVEAQDVQPEEMDSALAIPRIEEMTTLSIRRPARTWAGLRLFASDGDLVVGFDDQAPGFLWVAAQGSYGIHTAAAMGESCAALARGLPVPAHIAACSARAGAAWILDNPKFGSDNLIDVGIYQLVSKLRCMTQPLSAQASRIVDCAQALISAGGYNGFSYADISERVGITKAAIHHYFPKKSDLVEALVKRYRAAAAEGLAGLTTHFPSPAKRLDAYAAWWVRCIDDGSMPICICAMLAAEMPVLPEEVAQEVRLYFVHLACWLESAIVTGKDLRAFRVELDAKTEAEAFMATVHGAMLSARVSGNLEPFEKSVRVALERLNMPS